MFTLAISCSSENSGASVSASPHELRHHLPVLRCAPHYCTTCARSCLGPPALGFFVTSSPRDLVFISYSHRDTTWLNRLLDFLKPYRREGVLSVWADPYIKVGGVWRREIDRALDRSAVGVLLVSQNFLASDFINDVEIPSLLAAADRDLLTLFCIPISASTYQATRLRDYQWVHPVSEPLAELTARLRNRALVEITEKLVEATTKRAATAPFAPSAVSRVTRAVATPLSRTKRPLLGELHGVPAQRPHYLRTEDLTRLRHALLEGPDSAVGITAAPRLGLHGQGGIGKSVLAVALARDEGVRRAFPDGVHWIALGQDPDLLRMQETVASQITPREPFVARTAEEGEAALEKRFQGRSCLLVVDDVWDVRHARAFDVLGPRSRLLVTTRDGAVLTALGAKQEKIERLSKPVALELLARWAGVSPATLPKAAAAVARECGYLPLALAVAGAHVQDGISWSEALAALRDASLEFLRHPYGNVFRSMRLGIDALREDERARYLELAVFPEDERVSESMIIKLWKQTGGLDTHHSRLLLVKLERKALLAMSEAGTPRSVVLHDLQHDFLRILTEDLPALHNQLVDALAAEIPGADSPARAWYALPEDEGYPWEHLGDHLIAAERADEFQDLLLEYRWLEAKLRVTRVSALLSDFAAFPYDRDLALIARALRLSTHIIGPDPDQLPSQLMGRLLGSGEDRLRAFVTSIETKRTRPWLRPLTPSLHSSTHGLLHTLASHSGRVRTLAVRAGGRHVVSGSDDGSLTVWDMGTGREVWALRGDASGVNAVSWMADGQQVISGSDNGMVQVWEVETGEVRTMLDDAGGVWAVALSTDGKYAVSGSDGGRLIVWDVDNGARVWSLPGNSHRVNAVCWMLGMRRIVCGFDNGLVQVWDVETGEVRSFAGHSDSVLAVGLTADGQRVVSGSSDGTLRVWELETRESIRTITTRSSSKVTAITFSADGKRAAFGLANGKLEVCDLETGTTLRLLVGHSNRVLTVGLTADGERAVSYSAGWTLKVWEIGTADEVNTVDSSIPMKAVSVTADGRIAVSGSDDGTLTVWEVETGKELRVLECRSSPGALSLTADGRQVVSASLDGMLRAWDVDTGQEVSTQKIPFDLGDKIALTADGQCAFSGADHTLRVFNPATREVQTLTSSTEVTAIGFRADGRWVISGSSHGPLSVWETETGTEVRTLPGRSSPLSVALTADGCRVVSGAPTGWLQMWSLGSAQVEVIFIADGPIYACAASSDGSVIVAGDALGRVHFLRLEGVDERSPI